jgi:hypothetical protein
MSAGPVRSSDGLRFAVQQADHGSEILVVYVVGPEPVDAAEDGTGVCPFRSVGSTVSISTSTS